MGTNHPAKLASAPHRSFVRILLPCLAVIPAVWLAAMAGTTAYLFTRLPIYRATAKVLLEVPRTGAVDTLLANEIVRLDSQPVLRSTMMLLRKTPDEVADSLHAKSVSRLHGTTVLTLRVDSTSREFARDFANGWASAYQQTTQSGDAKASVLEPAVLEWTPVYPNKAKALLLTALVSVVVGLVLAVGLAGLLHLNRKATPASVVAQPPKNEGNI
jgi:uncharacterized protein involved in exopolysaccharide biosynthesis